MKNTKKAHERYVNNFKKKMEDKEKEENNKEQEKEEVIVKKENNSSDNEIDNAFNEVIGSKRKNKLNNNVKSKKTKFMNEEYYIPHFAPDEHTEKG